MTLERVVMVATVVSAVGCGVTAGLLFAFSTSVVPALAKQPADRGPAAMQAMNATILNPVFLALFMGTTAACALVAVAAPFSSAPAPALRLAGSALFVIGVFGVTMLLNVPLNNALDRVDPSSSEGQAFWDQYVTRWTAWNNVRTVAGVLAATMLTIAATR